MTKRQRLDLLDDIDKALTKNGWDKDSYGHYRNDDYRIKMQKTSMRYEFRNSGRWVNIVSDYHKNVIISDAGNVVIKGKVL